MLRIVEPGVGALLLAFILLDVFLTVLYARINTGIFSQHLARFIWRLFRAVSTRSRRGGIVVSFCGPVILLVLICFWALGLTLGTALIIHPHLVGSFVSSQKGTPPTDFVTAMYVGGSSMSIVGSGGLSPNTTAFRLFFLFTSLVGLSVLSLTLTYLMQVYGALQKRNALGLKLFLLSGRTGDAAELLARLGPQGQFSSGASSLAGLSEALTEVKESHHFYPVQFFFRFKEPYYGVSEMMVLSLDTIMLIESALDAEEYRWLKDSASVTQMADSAMLLLSSLVATYLSEKGPPRTSPDADMRERWRRRYFAALRRLERAGIRTSADEEAGAAQYVALRARWDGHVRRLAPAMDYTMEEIDPAGSHPEEMSTTRSVDFAGPPWPARRGDEETHVTH